MSSFSMSSPQCGESYSFSSGDSSCSCVSLIYYGWDSDKDEEDSRIADGVCSESESNVAPNISKNLEDSSIDLDNSTDNARSSDGCFETKEKKEVITCRRGKEKMLYWCHL
eukprot:12035031-Ditylum_brightwellii.AAC.1